MLLSWPVYPFFLRFCCEVKTMRSVRNVWCSQFERQVYKGRFRIISIPMLLKLFFWTACFFFQLLHKFSCYFVSFLPFVCCIRTLNTPPLIGPAEGSQALREHYYSTGWLSSRCPRAAFDVSACFSSSRASSRASTMNECDEYELRNMSWNNGATSEFWSFLCQVSFF